MIKPISSAEPKAPLAPRLAHHLGHEAESRTTLIVIRQIASNAEAIDRKLRIPLEGFIGLADGCRLHSPPPDDSNRPTASRELGGLLGKPPIPRAAKC